MYTHRCELMRVLFTHSHTTCTVCIRAIMALAISARSSSIVIYILSAVKPIDVFSLVRISEHSSTVCVRSTRQITEFCVRLLYAHRGSQRSHDRVSCLHDSANWTLCCVLLSWGVFRRSASVCACVCVFDKCWQRWDISTLNMHSQLSVVLTVVLPLIAIVHGQGEYASSRTWMFCGIQHPTTHLNALEYW